jgi:Domain of Unknown Function (DUF1206)
VVYLLIGWLAAMVAFEHRGRLIGTQRATERIGMEPYGPWLLALTAVGLFGYALWRVIEAISDLNASGSDWKGLAARAGVLASGVAYASLAVFAGGRALGAHVRTTNAARHWTAELLRHDWGTWLVVLIGLILIGAAVGEAIYAVTGRFRRGLETRLRGSALGDRSCKLGFLSQAVVLGLGGWFLINAARSENANKVQGFDGALRTLAHQPYGVWLLGTVAIGLACHGPFMLVQTRYSPACVTHDRFQTRPSLQAALEQRRY